MKIAVDYDLCEGNAKCMRACPEVFQVGDDDKVRLLIERPSEQLRAKVQQAVRFCPRQALSIVEQ